MRYKYNAVRRTAAFSGECSDWTEGGGGLWLLEMTCLGFFVSLFDFFF